MPSRSSSCTAVVLAASLLLSGGGGKAQAQNQCRSLMPIGGTGEPVVQKRISADRLVGRTNWNTDFAVDRGFSSYRVRPELASTARGTFPVAVFLRFTDGSNLQLVNQNLTLAPQEQPTWDPSPASPANAPAR